MDEELQTVVIDIQNKKFEVNGKPFDKAHNFHMSFEKGKWYVCVENPQTYRTEWAGIFDTKGNKILEEDFGDVN